MPGYMKKALIRLQHQLLEKPEHQPYQHVAPKGAVKLPLLNKERKTFVQQVIGVFLFYGRAVDGTMLYLLSAIMMDQQANPTQETTKKVKEIMDYTATHSCAIVTYRKKAA